VSATGYIAQDLTLQDPGAPVPEGPMTPLRDRTILGSRVRLSLTCAVVGILSKGYNEVQWGQIRHLRHLPKLAAYMFSTLEGSPDTRVVVLFPDEVPIC
jgi:hypothetical protein